MALLKKDKNIKESFIYGGYIILSKLRRTKNGRLSFFDISEELSKNGIIHYRQQFFCLHKKQKEEADFQYITTINRDSFEKLEANGDFDFDLNNYVRAEFSKADRFLRSKYVEKR